MRKIGRERTSALMATGLLLVACAGEAVDRPLPALGADAAGVTVSGVSSGGYMAVQFHVAHSATVGGAAVLAGGPWYCARGELSTALDECMRGPRAEIAVDDLIARARAAAQGGGIDPVADLAADRVWVFHGQNDEIMDPGVTQALVDFYAEFVPTEQIEVVESVPAAHTFPTVAAGGRCDVMASPHLGACEYDAAGELLAQLYGELDPPGSDSLSGSLEAFDQRPFRETTGSEGLADRGYVYIPQACRAGTVGCRVHIALHGCRQGEGFVEQAFVSGAGYNEWADANAIVILYPQVRATLSPLNPNGCWDWWGYEGPDYALRSGAQVAALFAMVERLAAPRD